MPNIRYINQSAPFWDFISSLEDQGVTHPFFGNLPHHGRPSQNNHGNTQSGPSNNQQQSADEKRGDVNMDQDSSDSDEATLKTPGPEDEKNEKGNGKDDDNNNKNENPCGFGDRRGACGGRGRRFRHAGGPCGGGRRGAGPFGGPRGGWWANGFPHGGGPMPGAFPGGIPAGLAHLGAMFGIPTAGGENNSNSNNDANAQEFRPLADVFDTESSYIIHLSLPGVRKEDVGVNWDADKSELSVAGVSHRLADEEMIKTLALDERRVGMFERKIRLGTMATPAQVDGDAITAKMEDGVLVVEVPKQDRDYVDVKKVDVM